jgi:hypothetical protein
MDERLQDFLEHLLKLPPDERAKVLTVVQRLHAIKVARAVKDVRYPPPRDCELERPPTPPAGCSRRVDSPESAVRSSTRERSILDEPI